MACEETVQDALGYVRAATLSEHERPPMPDDGDLALDDGEEIEATDSPATLLDSAIRRLGVAALAMPSLGPDEGLECLLHEVRLDLRSVLAAVRRA